MRITPPIMQGWIEAARSTKHDLNVSGWMRKWSGLATFPGNVRISVSLHCGRHSRQPSAPARSSRILSKLSMDCVAGCLHSSPRCVVDFLFYSRNKVGPHFFRSELKKYQLSEDTNSKFIQHHMPLVQRTTCGTFIKHTQKHACQELTMYVTIHCDLEALKASRVGKNSSILSASSGTTPLAASAARNRSSHVASSGAGPGRSACARSSYQRVNSPCATSFQGIGREATFFLEIASMRRLPSGL